MSEKYNYTRSALEKSASLMQAGKVAGVAMQGVKNTWNVAKPMIQNSNVYKKGATLVAKGINAVNTNPNVNKALGTAKTMAGNGMNKVNSGVNAFKKGYSSYASKI